MRLFFYSTIVYLIYHVNIADAIQSFGWRTLVTLVNSIDETRKCDFHFVIIIKNNFFVEFGYSISFRFIFMFFFASNLPFSFWTTLPLFLRLFLHFIRFQHFQAFSRGFSLTSSLFRGFYLPSFSLRSLHFPPFSLIFFIFTSFCSHFFCYIVNSGNINAFPMHCTSNHNHKATVIHCSIKYPFSMLPKLFVH